MSNRYIGGVVTETTNVAQSPWSGSWTEQAAMQGFGSVLRITNSLRFRASASAYLNRTPASAGNRTTWTYSVWHKRGQLGTSYAWLMNAYNTTQDALDFSVDRLDFWLADAVSIRLTSTAVFRDPSAWYHIVLVFDSTQATASNRIKMYVNGVQLTSFSTANYPSQNYQCPNINNTVQNEIGYVSGSTDGYMADINFIDGQALDPTAFGFINQETGVWAPKAYAGTYGLNGFHLDFKNATSTTTLGYDTSGNGNNWTTNNISLTAGSTYDWMIDSPSKIQGTGYGVGNYCVMNAASIGTDCTLSDGNLGVAYGSSGTRNATMATIGMSSGKWYFEFAYTGGSTPAPTVGISAKASSTDMPNYPGFNAYGWGYVNDGTKVNNATAVSYGATWTTGDVIGVTFDADAGSLTFYKNGTSQGVAFTGLASGTYYPAIGDGGGGATFTGWFNFGQRPFAYTPPTGYKTLCTQNLPVATIYNGAAYMAATLYTGNGATNLTVANANNSVSFQPGFVWIKKRGPGTANHCLNNEVMGVGTGVSLYSAATSAAGAYDIYGYLSAITSTGFTTQKGTDPTYPNDLVNESGSTYVAWQWKAGGTAVTNTAGSITSQVSANTTAGFSVVTYTGTGSAATVGHGLGVAPAMVITKPRTAQTVNGGWGVYHVALGATNYLNLNLTDAAGTNIGAWNNTAPTSSVFSIGTFQVVNTASSLYVAYCFAAIAGYSAFGSYTGNGSSDGPFVFTGMRPRWIMVKRTDSASAVGWFIWDTSRASSSGGNVTGYQLYPNSSTSESSQSTDLDILSNGFKLRGTYQDYNASGGTYIYAAFCENPFSVSLAR